MPPRSSQISPDSDNDDLADGGEGKYGMVAQRVTWIGSHLQRLQSANLGWEGQNFSIQEGRAVTSPRDPENMHLAEAPGPLSPRFIFTFT